MLIDQVVIVPNKMIFLFLEGLDVELESLIIDFLFTLTVFIIQKILDRI